MARRESVRIIVDAKDRASREFKQAEGGLGKLRAAAKGAAIAVAAVTTAAVAAGASLVTLAKRGGEVANVQRAFNNIFDDGERALQSMRTATRGLISDYDLMVQANRAVALGAVQSTEQFNQLAEAALALGRAQGVDAAMALESLALGIGRQSRLLLDNLGLIVSVEQATTEYAESLNKTVDQLTEVERREAFRVAALTAAQEKVEELGGITLTAADRWEQLTTKIANARDRLADMVASSDAVAEFFGVIERGIEAAIEKIPGLVSGLRNIAAVAGVGAPSSGSLNVAANLREMLANATTPDEVLAVSRTAQGRASAAGTLAANIRRRTPLVTEPGIPTTPGFAADRVAFLEQQATEQLFQQIMTEATARLREVFQGRGLNLTAGAPPTSAPSGGAGGMGPVDIPPIPLEAPAPERAQRGLPGGPLGGLDEALKKFHQNAERTNAALFAGVGAFQAVGLAAIRGAEDIEEVLIPSIANIAAAGVGGFWGAVIGAGGSLLGALLAPDRGNPVPVRLQEVDDAAARKMRQDSDTFRQTVVFGDDLATEEQLRQLGYQLNRIDRRRGGTRGVG